MRVVEFPYCCTAKLIIDCGQSLVAEGGAYDVKEETAYKWVKNQLLDEKYRRLAMMIVTTNNEQTSVNGALLSLGFSHSKWQSKLDHPNTKLRLWWISILDFKNKIKAENK